MTRLGSRDGVRAVLLTLLVLLSVLTQPVAALALTTESSTTTAAVGSLSTSPAVDFDNSTIDGGTPSDVPVTYNASGQNASNLTLRLFNADTATLQSERSSLASTNGTVNLTVAERASDFNATVELANKSGVLANQTQLVPVENGTTGLPAAPWVGAPDREYYPDGGSTAYPSYNASGEAGAASDVVVAAYNVTGTNDSLVAANTSLSSLAGEARVDIAASDLGGDVTLQFRVENQSSGALLANTTANWTDGSTTAQPAPYTELHDWTYPSGDWAPELGFNVTGQADPSDVTLALYNVTGTNETQFATNTSVNAVKGEVPVWIRDSPIDGPTTVELRVLNSSSGTVLANATGNWTEESLPAAPWTHAPNRTYYPNYDTTLSVQYNASGYVADPADVAVEVVNVTDGTGSVVASAAGASELSGTMDVDLPADSLSGDVTVTYRVLNASSETVVAEDNGTWTADWPYPDAPSLNATDTTYDPDVGAFVHPEYNASGVVSTPSDLRVDAYNATNGNGSLVASNASLTTVADRFFFELPASELSGNVTVRLELRNGSAGERLATDNVTLTDETTTYPPVSLRPFHGYVANEGVPDNVSTALRTEFSGSMTVENGSRYTFAFVRNGSEAFAAEVAANETFPDGSKALVYTHDGHGDPLDDPSLRRYDGDGTTQYDLRVVNGSIPSERGLANYSVRVRNASGSVVSDSRSVQGVFGYPGEVESAQTTDGVQLALPQSVLPDGTDVDLRVHPEENHSETVLDTSLAYSSTNETYSTTVPQSDLPNGTYGYRATVSLPSGEQFTVPSFATDPLFVGGENVTIEGQITEPDGTPAEGFLGVYNPAGGGDYAYVDSAGEFQTVVEAGGSVTVGFGDGPDSYDAPVNGVPDVYSFGTFNTSSDVEVVETLPDPHTVTYRVVDDDGDPLDEDQVNVKIVPVSGSFGESEPGVRQIHLRLNESGYAYPWNGTTTWELAGNVSFRAEPRNGTQGRFTGTGYTNVTVTGDRNVTVTVPEESTPPVPVVDANRTTPLVGESVRLVGADSYDNESYVAAANWTVNTPSGDQWSSDSANVTFAPSEAGNYTVSLTLTDAAGNQNTTTTNVTTLAPANVTQEYTFGNVTDGRLAAPDDLVVAVNTSNSGDETATRNVSVVVDGSEVATETVTVAGNETVTTTVHRNLTVGTHDVGVAGIGTRTIDVYEPADLSTTYSVADTGVLTTEPLVVNATVTNTGGVSGTESLALVVNGTTVATTNLTVDGGSSETATFTTRFDTPADYAVGVNELNTTTVTVQAATNPNATVAVASPEDGAVTDGSVAVDYTLSNVSTGIDEALYRVDDGSWQPVASGLTDTSVTVTSLSDGEHAVELALRDNAGNVVAPTGVPVTVDTTTPTLDLDAPSSTLVGPERTVDVGVSVADATLNETTAVLAAESDGTVVESVDLTDRAADGNATVAVDAANDSGLLPSGTYTLQVNATDAADLRASETVSVTVDTAAPTLSNLATDGTQTTDGQAYLNGSTDLTVSGDVSDTSAGTDAVTVRLASQTTTYNATTTIDQSDGTFSASLGLDGAPEGDYEVDVRATDAAGNTVTERNLTTVTYDATEPTIGVSVAAVNATHGRVTVQSDEALAAVPTASVTAPDSPEQSVSVTANGTNRYTGIFKFGTDGEYTATASGSDPAGNADTATSSTRIATNVEVTAGNVLVEAGEGSFIDLNLTTDTMDGAVASLSSSDTPLAEVASNLTGAQFVEGELGDRLSENLSHAEVGIPTSQVELPPGLTVDQVDVRRFNESANTWETVGTTSIETRTIDGTEREYVVVNVSHFSTYGAVAADQEAPTIDDTSPATTGTTYDYDTDSVTASVSYSDDVSGINTSAVGVQFDGTAVTDLSNVSADVTSSGVTVTATGLTGSGDHDVSVTAVDETGKTNSTTVPFTVERDTDRPTATTSLTDGATLAYDTTEQRVQVDYADALSGVDTSSVSVSVDGTTLADSETTVDTDYVAFTVADLSPGDTRNVTVSVSDDAGNTRQLSRTFSVAVDETAPTVLATDYDEPVQTTGPTTFAKDTDTVTATLSLADAQSGVDASAVAVEFGEAGNRSTVTSNALVTADSLSYTATDLAPGTTYELAATLVDEDGNTQTVVRTFEVAADGLAPTVAETTYSPTSSDDSPTFDASTDEVSVSLSVDDASGLNTDAVSVQFGEQGSTRDVTGVATVSADAVSYDASGLAANTTYVLTATLVDTAGNERTVTRSFDVAAAGSTDGDSDDSQIGTGGSDEQPPSDSSDVTSTTTTESATATTTTTTTADNSGTTTTTTTSPVTTTTDDDAATTTTASTDGDDGDGSSGGSVPGFTGVTAVVALFAAAVLAVRTRV